MGCSDPVLFHRLMDGDLDEAQAEILAHHAESCGDCRADTAEAAALRSFVRDRLGAEDEGEEEGAIATLAAISTRLPITPAARPRAVRSHIPAWLATAAGALIFVFLSLSFVPNLRALPTKILAEASARERRWMYHPNRILHWEVETVSRGVKGVEDGRWRTVFWQNNGARSFAQVSRQFDPQGRTRHAYWQQADGSTISYRSKDRVVEISPSTVSAQEALPALAPETRAALESYLARRTDTRALELNNRRDAEWLNRASVWNAGSKATFQRGHFPWGDVHYITIEQGRSQWNPVILSALHEYEIDSATLRLLRLRSTITYTDGTTGIHDSRWAGFRETSAEEFSAQTPRDLLDGGIPVVRLTPREIARRHLQELNQAETN